MKFKFYFLLLFFCAFFSHAQNRITDKNNIGWYNANVTLNFSERWGLQTEYHWRRVDYGQNWQQGLLRVGVHYKLTPETLLRVGYGWAETYPYGEIPLNTYGKDFTEHRIFEMVQFNNKVSNLGISHRFMLEQRWVGRYSNPDLDSEDSFIYTNRLRYMLRLQLPVYKKLYAAVYDELFIGFGENVGENVFDQNRFGALVGYPISKNFKLEGGYLSQIVQLGREVDNKNVFQKNNGFIISALVNFDLYQPEPSAK